MEKQLAQAARLLLARTTEAAPEEFFSVLVRTLAEVLRCERAFVGELVSPDGVRWRAILAGGEPDVDVPIGAAMLGAVLAAKEAFACADLETAFPGDPFVRTHGLHGCIASAVRDRRGAPVGVLIAGSTSRLDAGLGADAVIELFADRAALELERLHAERLHAESEARYRTIVENCPAGVWMIDLENRTTFVNERMASMLGVTPEEMLGHSLWSFMDDRARREAEENLQRRRSGISEDHEFRLRHANGGDVWTIMATTPLRDEEGRYVGALAFVSDETERRGLERRMGEAERLEGLARLAGGLAHDCNNLLVGILGNVSLALAELGPDMRVVGPLRDAETSALRLAELTRQLLAYSGKTRVVPQRVDPNALCLGLRGSLGAVISKTARFELRLAPSVPEVSVDPSQIQQMLVSLVSNASESLPDGGGTITLATGVFLAEREDLRGDRFEEGLRAGEYVYIDVVDTGVGIEPGALKRIFEPFFSTKFTGRGLGLAAALGIARGHGGTIQASSEVGVGSVFRVLLPVASSSDAPKASIDEALSVDSGTPLVVVAEDDGAVRRVAQRALARAGCEVVLAVDGAEALAACERWRDELRLAVLDLSMPKLDGDEVMRELRRRGIRVPIVLTSGRLEPEAMDRLRAGDDAFILRKPWGVGELVEVVRKALRART